MRLEFITYSIADWSLPRGHDSAGWLWQNHVLELVTIVCTTVVHAKMKCPVKQVKHSCYIVMKAGT